MYEPEDGLLDGPLWASKQLKLLVEIGGIILITKTSYFVIKQNW